MTRPVLQLTRTHRILIGVVSAGAVVIAAIGFAGSYGAVRALAHQKGFGNFALVFPVGIDAGIVVLLALDLLLTWIRIPFPLLRQTAWMLTAATIAFNGAAAWPDPLGVGMHAVIPVLFVVTVEAARHAVGKIADIAEDKNMDGVRGWRWLLSPAPTFKLWRRMKLWEMRSYEQAVGLEQDRLIYRTRLQAKYGRAWRFKAPVDAVIPLRLAKLGVPLAQTAPAGLAAAGILIEWRSFEPPARPEFEEHAGEALEIGNPASRPALLTAYAAEKPDPERLEVTLRVPEPPEPECEDEPHDREAEPEPAGEPAPDAPDTTDGTPAYESTKPPVAPGKNGTQDAPAPPSVPAVDPLAAHRERVAKETAAARSVIREKWDAAREENPKLTKAAFARMTEWTEAQVYAALKGH
ncbi:DUF2637 domain-containing protein [Streptomyces subrutilus]|uniref:DUF2637 domain-containing protein n=1 Tax=Streptomyces subrutilus TaxID=36818 RepID=UPI0009A026AB|nr:DUF2637 domain-containing protein [Streptomyces subrutilus]